MATDPLPAGEVEPRLRPLLRLAALVPEDRATPVGVRRAEAASGARLLRRVLLRPGPDATVDHVEVPVAGGRIPVRLYRPAGAPPGPQPLYVFLHGGGWVSGTLDERDPRCRTVAAGAGCTVASVAYRLAPEDQFPTGLEDCVAALGWLVDHAGDLGVDPDRVAIGGESAGANLAAVVCQVARDAGGPRLCHQWLDVPATDATLAQEGHRAVAPTGLLLDAAAIDDMLAAYLPDPALATDPRVSPLLAEDLSGLPPAWIMSAEHDRLRGDAAAYAEALAAAGVPARHVRLAGHVHPSFSFTRLLPSAVAYEQAAIAALAAALRG